jgi:hypothetical protein
MEEKGFFFMKRYIFALTFLFLLILPMAFADTAYGTGVYGGGEYSPAGIPGDINNNGAVNVIDLQMIVLDFGKTSGYDQRCDIAAPFGMIDLFDVMIVVKNWDRNN